MKPHQRAMIRRVTQIYAGIMLVIVFAATGLISIQSADRPGFKLELLYFAGAVSLIYASVVLIIWIVSRFDR